MRKPWQGIGKRCLQYGVALLLTAVSTERTPGQVTMTHDSLVVRLDMLERFYRKKPPGLFWCGHTDRARQLRAALRTAIDSAATDGLQSNSYIPGILAFGESFVREDEDSVRLKDWDRCYTTAALAVSWDLFCGAGTNAAINDDCIAEQYAAMDERTIADGLARVRTADDLRRWLAESIPSSREYAALKDSLACYRQKNMPDREAALALALNSCRWVHHFHFARRMVINRLLGNVRYYTHDTLALSFWLPAKIPAWLLGGPQANYFFFSHYLPKIKQRKNVRLHKPVPVFVLYDPVALGPAGRLAWKGDDDHHTD